MSGRRALRLALWCVLVAGTCPVAGAFAAAPPRPSANAIRVSLDRPSVATRLGASFGLSSTITNTGRRPLSGLVAHLNVVALSHGVYVDPEDWSPQRTKNVPALAPGKSARIRWTINAVNGGRLAVYVVAVPRAAPRTAASGLAIGPPMELRVAERRTINSSGVLFLALGMPGLLGLGTVGMRIGRQRGRRRAAAR